MARFLRGAWSGEIDQEEAGPLKSLLLVICKVAPFALTVGEGGCGCLERIAISLCFQQLKRF